MSDLGERYGPAMEIRDPVEARAFLDRLVAWRVAAGMDRADAEELERHNLGYYAGYFSRATFERVTRLFGAVHPIYGNAWPASPEEAIAMGRAEFERTRPNPAD